jgi:hypothetical protein
MMMNKILFDEKNHHVLSSQFYQFSKRLFPRVHFDNLYSSNDFIHESYSLVGFYGCPASIKSGPLAEVH